LGDITSRRIASERFAFFLFHPNHSISLFSEQLDPFRRFHPNGISFIGKPMRLFALLAALLPLLACAPEVRMAGPAVREPAIEAFTSPPLPWRPRMTTALGPAPLEPRPAGPEPAEALVMQDGARLPLRVWRPEGEARFLLLAIHGLGDHGGNFLADAGPILAAGGALTYAYDQRGFGFAPHRGVWPGAETMRDDALAAARLLGARHPGLPLFILGESMGASVVLLAGTAPEPPPAAGYLLSAPGLWGRAMMPAVMRGALAAGAHTIPRLAAPAVAGGIAASDNPEALRRFGADPLTLRELRVDLLHGVVGLMDAALAALPACCRNPEGPAPTLFLAGANDAVVPIGIQRRALGSAGATRLALYEDGWHLLLRDRIRERVAADILAFMADPARPLAAEAAGRDWLRAP
jgi:alpha-beta hydrolase superfamily lysophospholipase